ncbi:hypothetical protein BS78_05G035300 [Paspalum vaginatum]|nr:hypothetical protein BS78_05G035300 [Paspalum vaginatum]
MTWSSNHPSTAGAADHARLRELGYKQELKRHLSVLSNFSISFSIVSVLTGVTTLYSTGLAFGGPATMTLGWFLPGAFTMAEICSAFPTSNGLYFWSARLAGHRWAPFASWITGWFNIVAQWAGTASVDFSLAQLIQVIILLGTGGSSGGGYVASKYAVFAFHAGILLSHAVINSLSIAWLSFFGQLAAAWNMIGVFVLMIAVPLVATERASAKFIFTHFNTDNSAGIHSNAYIFILGLLMSQYTLTGYDASAPSASVGTAWPSAGPPTGRALGGYHHRALLAAGRIPGDQGHPQLHPGRRRRAVQGPRHEFGRRGRC